MAKPNPLEIEIATLKPMEIKGTLSEFIDAMPPGSTITIEIGHRAPPIGLDPHRDVMPCHGPTKKGL